MKKLLLVAFLLISCASHPYKGRLIEKHYDDADTWWTMACEYDKDMNCTSYIPMKKTDEEHFYLTFEDCNEGKCETFTLEVYEGFYNNIEIGEFRYWNTPTP